MNMVMAEMKNQIGSLADYIHAAQEHNRKEMETRRGKNQTIHQIHPTVLDQHQQQLEVIIAENRQLMSEHRRM